VPFFEELIGQDPDITLFELRDALSDATGLQVQHSAIGHLLKRLGFTHKKVTGGHRARQRQSKTLARRVVQTSPSNHRADT
jgi:transposase